MGMREPLEELLRPERRVSVFKPSLEVDQTLSLEPRDLQLQNRGPTETAFSPGLNEHPSNPPMRPGSAQRDGKGAHGACAPLFLTLQSYLYTQRPIDCSGSGERTVIRIRVVFRPESTTVTTLANVLKNLPHIAPLSLDLNQILQHSQTAPGGACQPHIVVPEQ